MKLILLIFLNLQSIQEYLPSEYYQNNLMLKTEKDTITKSFFYDSGNLKYQIQYSRENKKSFSNDFKLNNSMRFIKDGFCIGFYDNPKKSKRCEGYFDDNVKVGKWTIFRENQSLKYEVVFFLKRIKKLIKYDQNGNKEIQINKSYIKILVNKYPLFLHFWAMISIIIIRFKHNMRVYNKVNGTNFFPGFHRWMRGGRRADFECMYTFFWITKPNDTIKVRKLKKKANRV